MKFLMISNVTLLFAIDLSKVGINLKIMKASISDYKVILNIQISRYETLESSNVSAKYFAKITDTPSSTSTPVEYVMKVM
jgi:stringent starvation protein B